MGIDYAGLIPFCKTETQLNTLKEVIKHGSQAKAARATGRNRHGIKDALRRIKKNAANHGLDPQNGLNRPVSPDQGWKGTSTLFGEDGEVKLQWVKSQASDDKYQALFDALEIITDEIKPAKPIKSPKTSCDDILTVYPMGDPHIGLYSWYKECGEDFDTDIARDNLIEAMTYLTQSSAKSDRAVIVNLGDFYHADNMENKTMRSGNVLDVDTRWSRVLDVGIQAMIDCIDLALMHHNKVDVINAVGNHDDHSSKMLAAVLRAWYRNEPRANIIPNEAAFQYYEFGQNLIGVTHGDKIKPTELGSVMAADAREAWGRTEYHYWYTGHIHTNNKFELRDCMVESFRTLAAKDAWHTGKGYRSGRDMYAIEVHKEFGEVGRHRFDIRRTKIR